MQETIYQPIIGPKTLAMDPLPARERPKTKILLVEDNWDQARLTMTYLSRREGYQVELASSGAEALYKLARGPFSLLLLDYCMDGMDGLEVMQRIKEMRYDLPIIMVTGVGSEYVAVEAMKNGAYDYIIKRGDYLSTLPLLIDQALNQHRLEKIKEGWDRWLFKRNRELLTLNAVSEVLSISLKLDEVVKNAVHKTADVLRADYAEIGLIEAVTKPAGEGRVIDAVLVQVTGAGECLIFGDVTEMPMSLKQGLPKGELRSLVYLPLPYNQTVLGVMILGSRRPQHFTKEDARLLHAIGRQIGSAIRKAKLYQ